MPRAIWEGSISFGLVNIPVSLYPAEKNEALDFTMLDKRDMSPIGYKKVNKRTGREVDTEQIVKGYEYEKEQYVVLSDEELKHANVKATQSIDILEFVNADKIPVIYYERPYYLEPLKKIGEKGYVLLRETLQRTGQVGIANVVLRARQHLAMLLPVGDLLVLNLLRYHYELREPDDVRVPSEAKVSKKEIEMARRLVEDMTVTKWDPKKYRDDYRDDVMKLIERKVASGKTFEIETPTDTTDTRPKAKVIDFMSLLKESIDKKKPAAKRKSKPTSARHRKRA